MNLSKQRVQNLIVVAAGGAALVGIVGVSTATAAPLVAWSVSGSDIDSEGRCPCAPSSGAGLNNGIITALFPQGVGTDIGGAEAYPVGWVRVHGTVVPGNGQSWPSELRVHLRDISDFANNKGVSSGFLHTATLTQFNDVPITGPVQVSAYFDASALGSLWYVDNTFRSELRVSVCEAYDNPGAGVDAVWSELTVEFRRQAPFEAGPFIGTPMISCPSGPPFKVVDTLGSEFVTSMGLYTQFGELVESSDGGGTPDGVSSVSLDGLAPGEYYLAVSRAGASFLDGYDVTPPPPSAASEDGALQVNTPNGFATTTRTNPDSVVWFEFSLTPPPADLDGDGQVGSSDLAVLLGSWGPAGVGGP